MKTGDKIVCIYNTFTEGVLELNKVYTIQEFYDNLVKLVEVPNVFWNTKNFEPYNPEIEVFKKLDTFGWKRIKL